ncbi:MAG: hypothetical protein KAG97_02905 [Victivallales bacterium]|nr:hypothetical protein [Victivallales bacterium]
MKKLQEKPELLREVRGHNDSVRDAVREFNGYEPLEGARKQLSSSIIRPHSEMEGSGLRKTYVAIGREWMEEARIVNWRCGNKRVLKQERMQKALKFGTGALFALFALFNAMAIFHTVREDIVPVFGETMKKVGTEELAFEDLAKFAKGVLAKMATDDALSGLPDGGESLPPEIRMEWRKRMDKLRSAGSAKVKTILVDPKRKNVFHILCMADLPECGEVAFRLQCEKRDNSYAFMALE